MSQENIENLSPSQQALLALKKLRTKLEKLEQEKNEPIAIVSMACRYPGGLNSPEKFWQALIDGRDMVTEFPASRWDMDQFYDEDPEMAGKIYTRSGAFIDQVDQFDPGFFGISPREAHHMDPQQRILLAVCWEALERAGMVGDSLTGSNTGVFVGMGQNDYARLRLNAGIPENIDAYDGTGNLFCFATGRISYVLGLQGPNMAVDTACSSSLVSLHLACQSLRAKECDMALAGGIHLILSPEITVFLARTQALAPDGRCKAFAESADGYGRGEGCGVVVLKRLSDAVREKLPILALIKGSAVNQDGPGSGLTVPNKQAQQDLITQSLKAAKVKPEQVAYVDAHGTGTALGDPLEVRALAESYGQDRALDQPLLIGSVKTNIGHLEAAAGIASVMKVVLAMQHQQIPAQLHFNTPTPHVDWASMPIQVVAENRQWPHYHDCNLAGVSSFGMSGTNAHIVIAQYDAVPQTAMTPSETAIVTADRPLHILSIAAKSHNALQAFVKQYQHQLSQSEVNFADLCYSANTHHRHFKQRFCLLAADQQDALQGLDGYLAGQSTADKINQGDQTAGKVAFLFSGQGAQTVNMAKNLFECHPQFRETMLHCQALLTDTLEQPLLAIIFSDDADHTLNQTAYTQPALFAVEYALTQLWLSWGVEPAYVLGHSVGEYVAAVIAGVFSLEDGIHLIAERGRLMQALPDNGMMAAIHAPASKIEAAIQDYPEKMAIAAYNGPNNTVISGEAAALQPILETLRGQNIKVTPLTVSHAFHSPLMQPIVAEFKIMAETMTYHPPRVAMISNVTGQRIDQEIATADYWVKHISSPVYFHQGIQTLIKLNTELVLEIGPKPVLLGMAQQCCEQPENITWLASLRPRQPEWQTLLSSLSRCYCHGINVNWSGFDQPYKRQTLLTPTYPFQQQRYWVEKAVPRQHQSVLHPLIDQKVQSPLLPQILFSGVLQIDQQPYLADHQIYQQIVVPGANHLAMMMGACALLSTEKSGQFKQIVFPEALLLNEIQSRQVELMLTPENNQYTFQVISYAENQPTQFLTHVTGEFTQTPDERPQVDVESILARCQKRRSGESHYQAMDRKNIQLGTCFRWVKTIQLGEQEAICRMALDHPLHGSGFQLHPGLIDACFQFLLTTDVFESDAAVIPFYLEQLRAYPGQAEITECWCYVTINPKTDGQEGLFGDIQLIDDQGYVLMSIQGFEGRRANQQQLLGAAHRSRDWFYQLHWQAIENLNITDPLLSNWLIFVDQTGVANRLIHLLRDQGKRCIEVIAGDQFSQPATDRYVIAKNNKADYQQLLTLLDNHHETIDGILYIANQLSELTPQFKPDHGDIASVLAMLQALIQSPMSSAVLKMVTQGAIVLAEPAKPEYLQQSQIWALKRTMTLEYPELKWSLIDIDTDPAQDPILMLYQWLQQSDCDELALRRQRYYRPQLERQSAVTESMLTIATQGTYLITGGTGALGLLTTKWLLHKGAQTIVLCGRKPPLAETKAILDHLNQDQAYVQFMTVDVGSYTQVETMLKILQASMPPLKGIIHAAGVLDDSAILTQSTEKFDRVVMPKVGGLWHLHQLTEALDLDFFVCYASVAGLFGAAGQANYAAANVYMDAVMQYRHQLGLPAITIDWGPWQQGGMAALLSSQDKKRLNDFGLEMLEDDIAINLLDRLLGQSASQTVVAKVNWAHYCQQFSLSQLPVMLSAFASNIQPEVTTQKFSDQLKTLPEAQRKAALTDFIKAEVAAVLGMTAAEIKDLRTGFFTLGMDSLTSVELRNLLQKSLDVALPPTVAFNYPNVATLSDYLYQQMDNIQAIDQIKEIPDQLLSDLPTSEASYETADLESLSDDDLADMLASKLAEMDI